MAPQDAARELLRRREVRRSFAAWCRHCGYDLAAPHHALLAREIQAVADGETKRLAVFMPPGSAKSTYASVLAPAWLIAREGSAGILAASHSIRLAERFGRKVRGLVREHALTLGVGISEESAAADRWETTAGREYYAAGAGTGISGFRGLVGIIDDPYGSREDADSLATRERVWDWYNDDFDTRLVPGASRILVMTRWRDDDLAAKALKRDAAAGLPWRVVSIPAIAGHDDPLGRAPGEWLWEGEYGYADRLREKFKTADARSWSALYQQEPAPETGDYFKAGWLREVDALPPLGTLRIFGASDYATTARGGDYTVHVVVGVDAKNAVYLLDLWRHQSASDEWVSALADLVLKWRPLGWAEEQGQIKSGVGPFLERELRARRAFVVRETFPTRGDKATRAQSIRGMIAMHGLHVLRSAPFKADLFAELLRFPAGANDDQVDALGLAGQLIDKMIAPTARKPDAASPKTTYRPLGSPRTESMMTL